jgi:hypothetical protein
MNNVTKVFSVFPEGVPTFEVNLLAAENKEDVYELVWKAILANAEVLQAIEDGVHDTFGRKTHVDASMLSLLRDNELIPKTNLPTDFASPPPDLLLIVRPKISGEQLACGSMVWIDQAFSNNIAEVPAEVRI